MVTSRGGNTPYLTEISNGEDTLFADVPADKGDSGRHFRPHDLLEAAYASCLNMSARMVLDKLGIRYDEVTVEVNLDRTQEEKTIFQYRVDIQGDLDERTRGKVLKLIANCPVSKTLSKPIECRMDLFPH